MYLHVLETVTGLIFIYLLLSLLVTAIQELISTGMKFRSNMLKHTIDRMLNDPDNQVLAGDFFNHHLIKYLSSKKDKYPSYLQSVDFSKVITDLLKSGSKAGDLPSAVKDGIDRLPEGKTKTTILSFWEEAELDVLKFRKSLEHWFDTTMERASGWYKRKIHKWILVVGIAITIFMNADTFYIWERLSGDAKTREQVVTLAAEFVQTSDYLKEINKKDSIGSEDSLLIQHASDVWNATGKLLKNEIKETKGLAGIGWEDQQLEPLTFHSFHEFVASVYWWLRKLAGWIVTGLAISLGAPFWFDMLSKVVQIRMTGKKPEPAPIEQKK